MSSSHPGHPPFRNRGSHTRRSYPGHPERPCVDELVTLVTPCSHNRHTMVTPCPRPLHTTGKVGCSIDELVSLVTPCSHPGHTLFTPLPHPVINLSTPCSHQQAKMGARVTSWSSESRSASARPSCSASSSQLRRAFFYSKYSRSQASILMIA